MDPFPREQGPLRAQAVTPELTVLAGEVMKE